MINTPINPIKETMVSIILHVLMVSFTVRLKYSLNIQNPGSLTCENIKLPAPVASTINAGFTPEAAIMGATIPAAVKPATVAEPILTLIMAAIIQASNKG